MLKNNLAIIALTVSILSAVFTGFQSYIQYEHNRVSISPKLDWRFDYNIENGSVFKIRLVNVGLGPAIVKDISLVIDEEIVGLFNFATCGKLDIFLDIDELDHSANVCWGMEAEEELYMKSGEEITLYNVGPNKYEKTKWVPPSQAGRVGVFANYCSFYNECAVLD